jgi:hypothetical protein
MKLIAIWRHWDGSLVEFYDTGWRSTDPEKAEWLNKVSWLSASARTMPPVIKMWLEENCELIGFIDSQAAPIRREGKCKKLGATGPAGDHIGHDNPLTSQSQLARRFLIWIRATAAAWRKSGMRKFIRQTKLRPTPSKRPGA